MIDPIQLAPLYDFALIEKGEQDFFCALDNPPFVKPPDEDDPNREAWRPEGDIPFYTPMQSLVLQSCRPRVGIIETNFSEIPGARILDADGVYRAMAWRGTIKHAIITKCNYKEHRALRGAILSIIPMLQPLPADLATISNSGINKFLQYHEVGEIALQSGDTQILPMDGYYLSTFAVTVTFSVRSNMWPGGTKTN